MAHRHDLNVPLRLDAATLFEFEHDEEIVGLNARIADLSRRIAESKKASGKWWKECYKGYISGKGFTEHDTTNLFKIYAKYIPTRTRLRENLFKEVPIDSEDMVSLCTSTERVVYYPGLTPVDGQCPVCQKPIESAIRIARELTTVSKETSCSSATYHCGLYLANLKPRCGLLMFCYTLVAPGFCPFCLGDGNKRPDEHFKQWLNKAMLLNYIDGHLSQLLSGNLVTCPHPCCSGKEYGSILDFWCHLFDVHSIEEPCSNCVIRKRHWSLEPEESKTVPEEQPVEEGKRRKLV
ncbi:hypothetical protein GB937_000154 [Aspergillus fischeri]|nr:hypothetical protein GB937_000154 [Aspergillus fischeri]